MKNFICTVCPRGCHISVDGERVTGNGCSRGYDFGIAESTNPVRILTATVSLGSKCLHRLPCRTSAPIQKTMMMPCMEEIRKIHVCVPVAAGQVLIKNILASGVDLIATRTVLE